MYSFNMGMKKAAKEAACKLNQNTIYFFPIM